jgi:hypothetical protein
VARRSQHQKKIPLPPPLEQSMARPLRRQWKIAPPPVTTKTTAATSQLSPTLLLAQIEPMKPEEVLQKMQDNPKAASLLMKASSDPEIVGAVRIAMNGSPADLMKEAQRNPNIAKFLQDMWGALEGEDNVSTSINGGTAAAEKTEAPKSGLDAIRNNFQGTVTQWHDSAFKTFASGIID